MGLRFFVVDAFSERPFGGNPAVIVPEADGMSDKAMAKLAAELRMEAGFVLKPTFPDADIRIRFFSPGGEVDVSGHVTIAAYTALARAGKLPRGSRTVRQQSRAGVLPVELVDEEGPAGAGPWVTLDFGRPSFGTALDRTEVRETLRCDDGALVPGAPRIVTAGVALAVVALTSPSVLNRVVPDMLKLAAMSRRRGVLGIAAFARPGLTPGAALAARFFFPVVGPDEDVVSGAALAAIVAHAVRERQLACVREAEFLTDQGQTLGRPNRAKVTVRTEAGHVASVRVRGRGCLVAEGQLHGVE